MTFIAPTMTDEEVAAWEQQMRAIDPLPRGRFNSEKAIAIGNALRERYPCAVLPPGTLTDIGAEFGVSREYARLIAREAGITPTRGSRNPKPRRFCGSCGTEMTRTTTSAICRPCRIITLPCEDCGAPVQRSAARLAYHVGREVKAPRGTAIYTGRVFCDHRCHGRWLGKRNRKTEADE